MRKCWFIIFLLSGMMALAQDYKSILQHLSEYSDREALYRLNDYRLRFPQQPHPYYQMGNVYFRLQADEHPLVDYATRKLYLYNARLYYGNCRAFIGNEKPKAERYPEIAVNGKIDEVKVCDYLSKKIAECEDIDARVDALYASYSQLVNDYDTCLQAFTLFSNKYARLKEAQMLMDDEDIQQLRTIKEHAARVKEDIKSFKKTLKKCPISGYEPVFSYRTISFYRIDGLVGSDFLQNDIVLWDYEEWVEDFESNQKGVVLLRQELNNEYERLMSYCSAPPRKVYEENRHLLNNLEKYDEGTPMRDWMHLLYEGYAMRNMERQIIRDSVSSEEWVVCLQLAYRMNQLNTLIHQQLISPEIKALSSSVVSDKYASFIEANYPNAQMTGSWAMTALNNLSDMVMASNQRVLDWISLQVQKGLPTKVRINETMVAEVADSLLFYEELTDIL